MLQISKWWNNNHRRNCVVGWNVETLKEHVDTMFADRDLAVKVAFDDLQRRLDLLNHAHQIAVQKERDFFSRDQHDAFATNIHNELDNFRREIVASKQPNYQLWIMGAALLITIVGSLWWMATTPYQTEIARLRKDLDEHLTQMEQYNDALRKLVPNPPQMPRRP